MLPEIADINQVRPRISACRLLPDPNWGSSVSCQDKGHAHTSFPSRNASKNSHAHEKDRSGSARICARFGPFDKHVQRGKLAIAAYPGAEEDQQTGGHQVDQTRHLHIGSSFLSTTQFCLLQRVI